MSSMSGEGHENTLPEDRLHQALATARAALTEIATMSGGPIRRIALDALDKMETD